MGALLKLALALVAALNFIVVAPQVGEVALVHAQQQNSHNRPIRHSNPLV